MKSKMKQKKEIIINLILILSIVGIVTSIYLINNHFSEYSDGFCDINKSVSCSLVNTSKYSEIFNVPVPICNIGRCDTLFS